MMISCPEEIAYRMGYITNEELLACGHAMKGNAYGQYLIRLAESELG
jgi:glucose-1-phosphate thymidylyltransferase